MQDAKVRGALLAICLACLLGSGLILLRNRQAAPPPIVFSAPPAVPVIPADKPAAGTAPGRPARLYVDVAGAVRRPSLYLLPRNSRVMQAILAAGGPAADADMDAVNLAEVITDGEKVFVPTRNKAAVTAGNPPARSLPAAAAVSPKAAKGGKSAKGGSHSAKISADSGEQIGLNSATLEQLERLPGVGPSMAAKILAYRQQSGGFAKVDDLTLVPGIGPKKLAKLAPLVSLN